MISEVYVGYSYLALTSSLQAHAHTLPLRRVLRSIRPKTAGSTTQSLYESALKSPPYEIPAELAKVGNRLFPNLAAAGTKTYPEFINDESLALFVDQTKAYRTDLTMLFNAGEQLRERYYELVYSSFYAIFMFWTDLNGKEPKSNCKPLACRKLRRLRIDSEQIFWKKGSVA